MKRIFKKLFKKKYLLNRLVQKYSLLLTSIILLTVAALCVYVTYTINLSIDSQKNNAVSQIDSYVTNKNNAATNMINELAGSASKIENMRKYMELSPPEYFDYTYSQWSEDRVSTHFGNNLSTLFSTFPDLEEVIIRLDEFDQVLFANRTATNGKKMDMSSIKKTWLSTNANYLRSLYRTTAGRVVHCVFKSRVARQPSRLIEKIRY